MSWKKKTRKKFERIRMEEVKMRILRLKLSNFRQYKDTEIFFPQKGLIGIVGNNGSGKSTILNAIRWALYGRYDGVTQKQLKRLDSPNNAATYIELDFVLDGDYYRVRRDLNTSNKRNYIKKNKELVASGITAINEYIHKLLKMDEKAFENCYYAKQGEFDSLIKMNEAPRFQMISKLLNVDAIDKAAEISRKKAREVDVYIKTLEEFLTNETNHEALLEDLLSKQMLLSKELKNTEEALSFCGKKHEEIKKTLAEYERKHQLFIEQNETLNKLKTEKDSLEKYSLKNIEAELMELEHIKVEYEKNFDKKNEFITANDEFQEMNALRHRLIDLKRLRDELKNKKAEQNSIRTTLDEVKNELKKDIYNNLNLYLNELQEEMEKLTKKKETLNNKLIKQRSEIEFLGNKYREQVNEINSFDALNENIPCPTCSQPLSKEHKIKHLANLEEEKQIIENKIRSIKKQYDDNNELLNTVNQKEVELTNKINHLQNKVRLNKQILENKLNELETKLKQNQEEEKALSSKIKEFESSIHKDSDSFKKYSEKYFAELQIKLNELRIIYEKMLIAEEKIKKIETLKKDKEKIKKDIEDLNEEIKKTKRELKKIGFEETKFNELKNKERKIQQDYFDIKEKKNQIVFALDNLKEKIFDCNKNIELHSKRKKELKNKRKEYAKLMYLNDLLKQYKIDYLNKDISPALSQTMSNLIDLLTGGKYHKIDLDENFNTYLYRNNERLPISMFSEGERQLVAIVQRLAISQLLSVQIGEKPLELIMLDEIFGSMDNERQDALIEMFQSLTRTFNQIIIVSHNEYVKDSFEHTLVIELDEDSTSRHHWKLKQHNEDEVKELVEKYY